MIDLERDNNIIQIGGKASGKTEFCRRVMSWQKPKRCLVLDWHNEYQELDEVGLNDGFFANPEDWNGHKRIALWDKRNNRIEQIRLALDAIKKFTNGLLIIEDANMLTQRLNEDLKDLKDFLPLNKAIKTPLDLCGYLATSRSRRTSIIMNTHCYALLTHPKVGSNFSFLVVRKTPDTVGRYADTLNPNTKREILEAEDIVRGTLLEQVTIKL